MTLKEKVAEVEPESIADDTYGGVLGCPYQYKYLHVADYYCVPLRNCTVPLRNCTVPLRDCTACWNREYKEATDAV